MKTAVWLYVFMFIAIFDLHAQYPVLSPFALSLGAAPSFIGLIMGMYSATHIPGNILAGYGVDRLGSKRFIVFSLMAAGVLLCCQAYVTDPWQLLWTRSLSGFVLAFLSPACLALLAKMAKNQTHQGMLMSGNGFVHTLASVVSPAVGALLVAKFGFQLMFMLLGWILIVTGALALFGLRDVRTPVRLAEGRTIPIAASPAVPASRTPWLFYLTPLAISCSQGILFFELPLAEVSRASIMTSGILFSIISLGALATLSMLFLNRLSPFLRTAGGGMLLAAAFFVMAVRAPVPLSVSLFVIGMAKGMIYPAMATYLAGITHADRYGKVFALMSVSFSIGAFIGPVLAGHFRSIISPYYISFAILMIALSVLPYSRPGPPRQGGAAVRGTLPTFPGK